MLTTPTKTTVPLAALEVSPFNARAHDDGQNDQELAGLADSIAAVGLLHPLVVHEIGKGKFGVIAGRRRFMALRLLIEDGPPPADGLADAIPVTIVTGTDDYLAQASVAENLQRAEMDDRAMFRSIQQIFATAKSKPTIEMLAQSFGTSEARVKRLVRLAHVHPTILEAYYDGQLDRSELEDFAKSPDPEEQLQVWQAYQNDELGYGGIGRALGFDDRDAEYRLTFVGRDEYLAAGGTLEEDLFEDGVRVGDPLILEQMVNAKLAERRAQIEAEHPERVITFTFDPQRTKDGYTEHSLIARPVYDDETAEALEDLRQKIDALDEPFQKITGDQWWRDWKTENAVKGQIVPKEPNAEWDALIAQATELIEERTRLRETAKIIPANASICQFEFGRDGVKETWWFATFADAGQVASRNSTAATATPAAKPGEEGFDPDQPTLTQKAVDHIAAMKVRAATRHLLADTVGAGRAHRALVFCLGYQLAHPHSGDKGGLVWSFAGDTFGYSNCDLGPIDVPDVPGLKAKSFNAGWAKFDKDATIGQVDQLAAWVFGRKIDPSSLKQGKSVVTDVTKGLLNHDSARAAYGPDLDVGLFKLFGKKVLAAFIGTFDPAEAKTVEAMKGDAPKETAERLIGKADADAPGWQWLPAFLRWPK